MIEVQILGITKDLIITKLLFEPYRSNFVKSVTKSPYNNIIIIF